MMFSKIETKVTNIIRNHCLISMVRCLFPAYLGVSFFIVQVLHLNV